MKIFVVSEPAWEFSDEGWYIDDMDHISKSTMRVFLDLKEAKAYARDLDEKIAKNYLNDLCSDYEYQGKLLSVITEMDVD